VLFVSHQMSSVKRLCDRVILIDHGKIKIDGPAEEVVEAYLAETEEEQEAENRFPVMNSAYRIGIDYCRANVITDIANKSADLVVEVGVVSGADRPYRRMGIGFGLYTSSGDKVARLGPLMTNYTFDIENGMNHFVIESTNIGQILAAGKYVVSLWLAMPGISRLIELDNAAIIQIPELYKFASGKSPRVDINGPLILPLTVRQTDNSLTYN